jgi:hypothetical protein
MIRTAVVSSVLIAGLLVALPATAVGTAPDAVQAAGQISAADAAPFVGNWTLTLEGPNGPATFDLSIKVEQDKVVGEIKSAELPAQPITDITKADKSLLLRYSFDYQGNQVPTVVSLVPAEEGKTKAQIDFAGGAYVMSGTAAKKDAAK